MMISTERMRTILEKEIWKGVPVALGQIKMIYPRELEFVSSTVESSAVGDYSYTTVVSSSDTEEEAIKIGSAGKPEVADRAIVMDYD